MVKWVDARMEGGPVSIEEVLRRELMVVVSAGLYLNEDDTVLRLAQDMVMDPTDPIDAQETYRQLLVIPKVNILQKNKLIEA